MTAGLTEIRKAPLLSSGRHWTTQIDGRSPAAGAAVTSSEASSQGVRRCDLRLGEAVLDGGLVGHGNRAQRGQ